MLGGMAFDKPSNIPATFDLINNQFEQQYPNDDAVTEFLTYVKEYYVHGRPAGVSRNGTPRRRRPPSFPPALWSVEDRTELGLPRCQNNAESWNKRWKLLVGRSHAGVIKTFEEFQREEHATNSKIHNGLLHGFPVTKSHEKYLAREEKLRKLLDKRSEMPPLEFLKKLAFKLQDVRQKAK